MARIPTYQKDIYISDLDRIIGTDGDTNELVTKNFFLGDIAEYVIDKFIDPDAVSFTIPVLRDTQDTLGANATRITGSIMSQDINPDGTLIAIAGKLQVDKEVKIKGKLTDGVAVPGQLILNSSLNATGITIKAPSNDDLPLSYTIELPNDIGTAGSQLTTDGISKVYWADPEDDNLTVTGDFGQGVIDLDTQSLNIVGGANVATTMLNQTLTISAAGFITGGGNQGFLPLWDATGTNLIDSKVSNFNGIVYIDDKLNVSGSSIFNGDVTLPQFSYLYFGNNSSNQLSLTNSLSGSTLKQSGSGDLLIQCESNIELKAAAAGGGTEALAKFKENGPIELYYDNVKTFETSSTGVAVTGAQSSFSGQVTIPATPVAATDAASKSYVDALTRVESLTAGTYLNNSGTAADVILNHDATTRSDTTSSSSPAYGGTINVVNTITTNATGHVTAVDIETVTFPAAEDYTWTAAADAGSNRIIQNGNTIDFAGGTNINTENAGGETRFNLDDNITLVGTITVGGSSGTGTSGIYGNTLLGTSSTNLVEILATLRLDGPVKDKTNTLGTDGQLLVSNSNGELKYSPRLLVDETNGRLSVFNATASTIPSGDNFTLDVRTEKGRLQVEGEDVDGIKLDFENSSGVGTAAIENNGSQNQILKIRSHGTSGTLGEIRFETNSVEAVRIDENQRVGVGTISPEAMLDVVASSSTSRALDVQTNSGSLSITNSDTNGCKINFKFGTQSTTTASLENNGSENQFLVLRAQGTTSTDGNIRFVTNGTDAMRIDENQNVGIGVTSPSSKLEVDGGDIEIDDAASGLILRSPNGTRYRIKVDNSGNLSTTAV